MAVARAGVEPTSGHLKHEHRMTGNRLKGALDDQLCTTLAIAGMNFHKVLKLFGKFPIALFFACPE